MSMPAAPPDNSGSILLKLGEMGAQIAVIIEKMSALPDHEERLRQLEAFRWKVTGVAIATGLLSGAAGAVLGHITLH